MPLLPDHRVPGEAEDANGLAEDEGVDVESLDVAADHCRGANFFQLIMLNLFFYPPLPPYLSTLKNGIQPVPTVITE